MHKLWEKNLQETFGLITADNLNSRWTQNNYGIHKKSFLMYVHLLVSTFLIFKSNWYSIDEKLALINANMV